MQKHEKTRGEGESILQVVEGKGANLQRSFTAGAKGVRTAPAICMVIKKKGVTEYDRWKLLKTKGVKA
jgi:hypothetical protein